MSAKLKVTGAALAALIASLAVFEGRSLVAYIDPVGIPTICEGWTHGVKIGDKATTEQCDELTLRGINQAEQIITKWLPNFPDAPIMRAAYVSFIYNVGAGAPAVKDGFVWLKSGEHSTMFNLLNAGNYSDACDEFPKWTLAGGKRLNGLVKRRAAEREMCHEGLRNYTNNRDSDRMDDKRLAAGCAGDKKRD